MTAHVIQLQRIAVILEMFKPFHFKFVPFNIAVNGEQAGETNYDPEHIGV